MDKQSSNTCKIKTPYIPHSKYKTITYEARKALIQMVQQNGTSIYAACKFYNIKHSTGKAIMRMYRKSGKIFKRKHEQLKEGFKHLLPLQQVSHKQEEQNQYKNSIKADNQEVMPPQPTICYQLVPNLSYYQYYWFTNIESINNHYYQP